MLVGGPLLDVLLSCSLTVQCWMPVCLPADRHLQSPICSNRDNQSFETTLTGGPIREVLQYSSLTVQSWVPVCLPAVISSPHCSNKDHLSFKTTLTGGPIRKVLLSCSLTVEASTPPSRHPQSPHCSNRDHLSYIKTTLTGCPIREVLLSCSLTVQCWRPVRLPADIPRVHTAPTGEYWCLSHSQTGCAIDEWSQRLLRVCPATHTTICRQTCWVSGQIISVLLAHCFPVATYGNGLTLDQVMAWCLLPPSHCLIRCWFINQ